MDWYKLLELSDSEDENRPRPRKPARHKEPQTELSTNQEGGAGVSRQPKKNGRSQGERSDPGPAAPREKVKVIHNERRSSPPPAGQNVPPSESVANVAKSKKRKLTEAATHAEHESETRSHRVIRSTKDAVSHGDQRQKREASPAQAEGAQSDGGLSESESTFKSPRQLVEEALAQMPDGRTMYIGNLPFDAAEDDLKELLESKVGLLEALLFPRNNSGRPSGYAFAAFVQSEDLERALQDSAEPLMLNERCLRLDLYSQTRRERLRRKRVKPKEMRRLAAAARERRQAVRGGRQMRR